MSVAKKEKAAPPARKARPQEVSERTLIVFAGQANETLPPAECSIVGRELDEEQLGALLGQWRAAYKRIYLFALKHDDNQRKRIAKLVWAQAKRWLSSDRILY
jgi:hypothetical protein